MIKGDSRNDIIGQQLIDQVVVVVDTRLIPLPDTARKNSRPPDGEPVAVHSHGFQQLNVLLVFVVGVAGYISTGAVLDISLHLQHVGDSGHVLHRLYLGESVPDVDSLPVLVPASLYLVSSSSAAPGKVLREVTVEELLLGWVGQHCGEQGRQEGRQEDRQETHVLHLSLVSSLQVSEKKTKLLKLS